MNFPKFTKNVNSRIAFAILKKGGSIVAGNERHASCGGVETLLKGREGISAFLHFEESNEDRFGGDIVRYYAHA